jgi:hypothetical protein
MKMIYSEHDHATVIKMRKKGRIVKVDRKVIFGTVASVQTRLEESTNNTENASYIEQGNLGYRLL